MHKKQKNKVLQTVCAGAITTTICAGALAANVNAGGMPTEEAEKLLPAITSERQRACSDAVDALMRKYFSAAGAGGVVGVLQRGEFIHKGCYGLAEIETARPFTADTPTYLASLSKAFTAMAIMILREQGRLSFDDKLHCFVPGLPETWAQITVRQLLTHTSGLPDIFKIGGAPRNLTNEAALRKIIEHGVLDFTPGSAYKYSNSGYIMLALIVEQSSGMSFADFLGRHVFDPLNMRASYVWRRGLEIPGRAIGYRYKNGNWEPYDYNLLTTGGGGIYSTLEDLRHWARALDKATLLPQDLMDEAFTAQAVVNESTGYGYGWRISTFHGMRQIAHTGSLFAFRNAIVRLPDADFTLIILTNAGWTNEERGAAVREIMRIYFPEAQKDKADEMNLE